MPKKKTEELTEDSNLINATFLSRDGEITKVTDVINKDDCWYLKSANKWILTHNAIKNIARVAGISINYEVVESANIVPDYRNELEHIVRVTIHCKAKCPEGATPDVDGSTPCVHSDERTLTITGEANRVSTPNRGRGYLRKMAEKRAFDIAVLEHLGLYSSVFSEEESQDFEKDKGKDPKIMPGTKEFEDIAQEINALLATKTLADVKRVGRKIKKRMGENKYTEKQVSYLRELYQKEAGQKESGF